MEKENSKQKTEESGKHRCTISNEVCWIFNKKELVKMRKNNENIIICPYCFKEIIL